MGRRQTPASIGFSWHRDREKNYYDSSYVEYYGNPSEQALRTFNHLLTIGKTRAQPNQTWVRPRFLGYLIHYVHRGQYWHRAHGREFRVREGGIYLADCSQPLEQGNDQPQTTDLWWIHFDGREVPHLVAELGVDRNPVFDHIPRRRFQSLFRQLWTVTARKPVGHEARAHVILAAILGELFIVRAREADLARHLGREAPPLSERMHAAIDFIARYVNQPIGLKDIAAGVGMNLYHFARQFRLEVGMPPIQYLNRFRMDQAKRLLTTTEKSIAEVGRLVGIPRPAYFTRLFHQFVGESPQAYRERAGSGG